MSTGHDGEMSLLTRHEVLFFIRHVLLEELDLFQFLKTLFDAVQEGAEVSGHFASCQIIDLSFAQSNTGQDVADDSDSIAAVRGLLAESEVPEVDVVLVAVTV